MLHDLTSVAMTLINIACGTLVILRCRDSPAAILGGIAFGLWATVAAAPFYYGMGDIDWEYIRPSFAILHVAGYLFLLAGLLVAKVHRDSIVDQNIEE